MKTEHPTHNLLFRQQSYGQYGRAFTSSTSCSAPRMLHLGFVELVR